jgi:hypothetical protein
VEVKSCSLSLSLSLLFVLAMQKCFKDKITERSRLGCVVMRIERKKKKNRKENNSKRILIPTRKQ